MIDFQNWHSKTPMKALAWITSPQSVVQDAPRRVRLRLSQGSVGKIWDLLRSHFVGTYRQKMNLREL